MPFHRSPENYTIYCWRKFCITFLVRNWVRVQCAQLWSEFQNPNSFAVLHHILIIFIIVFTDTIINTTSTSTDINIMTIITKISIVTIWWTCKAAFLCLPLRRGRAATARSPTSEITAIEPTEASHTELSE